MNGAVSEALQFRLLDIVPYAIETPDRPWSNIERECYLLCFLVSFYYGVKCYIAFKISGGMQLGKHKSF